jgi:hypothetical protein
MFFFITDKANDWIKIIQEQTNPKYKNATRCGTIKYGFKNNKRERFWK